jgi:activator of HSP90 ATPase
MSIHQEIVFSSDAKRLFEVLTEAQHFSQLTDSPATITAEQGGQFSLFGGMISGQTIEIVPHTRLVQAWRAGNWPSGVYSIIKFELTPIADHQTRLTFDQCGYPQEHQDHLATGWQDRYWTPIEQYLKR